MTPLVLPSGLEHVLMAVLVAGTAVWIGGFIAIMVVSTSSRQVLNDGDRVALFRALGRRYLKVATIAAVAVVLCGGLLLASSPFGPVTVAILVLVGCLVVATILGVAQARRMSRLRHDAHSSDAPGDFADQLWRGAIHARVLRTAIGILSLGVYVLAFMLP